MLTVKRLVATFQRIYHHTFVPSRKAILPISARLVAVAYGWRFTKGRPCGQSVYMPPFHEAQGD